MNYNFYNTVIFSGILYGFVFVLSVGHNHRTIDATRFLIVTVLCLTLSNLQYWLIDIGLNIIPNLYCIQFELLILPFFYMFLPRYLQLDSPPKEWLLFIPFGIGMAYQVFAVLYPLEGNILSTFNLVFEIMTILYNVTLITLCLVILYRYEANLSPKDIGIPVDWLKYSIWGGLALCLVWFVTIQALQYSALQGQFVYYPIWIGISLLIYYLGGRSIMELRTYHDRRQIWEANPTITPVPSDGKPPTNGPKGKSFETFETIIFEIKSQKMYLDLNLSLALAAEAFKISSGYLSQIIGMYNDKGFNDFINQLRVEVAKHMLADPSYGHYTILAIGLEVHRFKKKSRMKFLFQNNIVIVHIGRIAVMLKIILYHLVRYIARTPHTVPYGPKMPAPVFLAKSGKFLLKTARSPSLEPLHKVAYLLGGAILDMYVDVVLAYHSLKDAHVLRNANLLDKIPAPDLNIALEDMETIFRDPYHMRGQPRNRMARLSLFVCLPYN